MKNYKNQNKNNWKQDKYVLRKSKIHILFFNNCFHSKWLDDAVAECQSLREALKLAGDKDERIAKLEHKLELALQVATIIFF